MKKLLLTLILVVCAALTHAQQTLYNMDVIGQSTQVNPSLMPENGLYIGLPMFSSTQVMFTNSGFTWRDLHRVRADDSINMEFEYAISQLAEKNFISLTLRTNIIETGIKIKNNYFTMNVAERAYFNFTFPKELFELLYYGNGKFVGQEVDLKRLSFDATHYREYAIGWTRAINKKVTVGGRFKYLYGMENFSSARSNLSFYTAPDDYQLDLTSDYIINTSMTGNKNSTSSDSYLFGLKNTGFAADMSVTYFYNERWKLNASIIDFGYIHWKSNVKNLVTAQGSYSFGGVDITDFMGDSSSSMESVTDSLSDSFEPIETANEYKTNLPTHVYTNVSYLLDEKMSVNGLFHGEFFRETVQPSFTFSLNRRFSKNFSATVNWSMINHHFNNAGAGLAFHAGALQFYVLSDNLIGTINPLSNNTAHFQFGLNLIFKRAKDKKQPDYGIHPKMPSDTRSTIEQEPDHEQLNEDQKKKEKEQKEKSE